MKLLSTERPMFGTRVMVMTRDKKEYIAALYASGQFFRDNFSTIEYEDVIGWRPLTDEEANAEPEEKPKLDNMLTLDPLPEPTLWQKFKKRIYDVWNNVVCKAIDILEGWKS